MTNATTQDDSLAGKVAVITGSARGIGLAIATRYAALGATVPLYAHLSMILGDDGQKLSKRRNSVAVTDYDDNGYLRDAVINYLARLGWSHGDDEMFSREQFVEWFDLDHITASAAQFNTEKLNWLNQQYIKQSDDAFLAADVAKRLARRGIDRAGNRAGAARAARGAAVLSLGEHLQVQRQEFAHPDRAVAMILQVLAEVMARDMPRFLGLGVQPPDADLGSLVRENIGALAEGRAAVLAPAIAIASLTIAVNLVIDNLPGRLARERGAR